MGPGVDPRVRRFIERAPASIATEVEAELEAARACSPADRWRQFEQLTGVLAWVGTGGTSDRARVLEWRDPPHPSYAAIVQRLRAGRRP